MTFAASSNATLGGLANTWKWSAQTARVLTLAGRRCGWLCFLCLAWLAAVGVQAQPAPDMHVPRFQEHGPGCAPYPLLGSQAKGPKFTTNELAFLANNFSAFYLVGTNLLLAEADYLASVNSNFQMTVYINESKTASMYSYTLADIELSNKTNLLHYLAGNLSGTLPATNAGAASVVTVTNLFGTLVASTAAAGSNVTYKSGGIYYFVTWLKIDNELMRIEDVTNSGKTATLTVTRGFSGTTPAAHTNSSPVLAPAYGTSPTNNMTAVVSYFNDPGFLLMRTDLWRFAEFQYTNYHRGMWLDILGGDFGCKTMGGETMAQSREWDVRKNQVYSSVDYQSNTESGINFIQTNFFARHGFNPVIWGNNLNYPTATNAVRIGLLQSNAIKARPIDGYCQENGIGHFDDGVTTSNYNLITYAQWATDVQSTMLMEELKVSALFCIMDAGVQNFNFAQLPANVRHDILLYGYSTYLLGVKVQTNDLIYSKFVFNPLASTNGATCYLDLDPIFLYQIGRPTLTLNSANYLGYKLSQPNAPNTFMRPFENGLVLVNPSDNYAQVDTVSLPGLYYDPESGSNLVSQVQLPAKSGRILFGSGVVFIPGTWNTNASGAWSVAANWTNGVVPNGIGDTANLTYNITGAAKTVTLDTAVTLGTLALGDADSSTSYTLAQGAGSLTFDNAGNGTLLNQISSSAGDTVAADMVLADDLFVLNDATNTLTISGDIDTGAGHSVTFQTSGANSINNGGVIKGAGGVTKLGQGTLALFGTNAYTGVTMIEGGGAVPSSAGMLAITNDLALGAVPASPVTNAIILTNNGTLRLTNSLTLHPNRGILLQTGASNDTQLSTFPSSVTVNYAGVISGGGNLWKGGAGTLILSGTNNSFAGRVVCWQATLRASSLSPSGQRSSLGTGTTLQFGSGVNGGNLEYVGAGDVTDRQVQVGGGSATGGGTGGIYNNGTGPLQFTNPIFSIAHSSATVARTFTLGGSNAGPNLIAGAIADNNLAGGGVVRLTKKDSGAWILSGTNTYTGGTFVSNGTLRLDGSVTGLLSVNAGTTLSGSGLVNGALALNGTVIPSGSSTGASGRSRQLTAASAVLSGGAVYVWEITNAVGTAGSDWSLLNVLGTLDVQAAATNKCVIQLRTLTAGNLPGPVAGFDNNLDQTWLIARAGSLSNFDASKFTLLDTGFTNDLQGGVFSLVQSGNDLLLQFTHNPAPVFTNFTVYRGTSLTCKITLTNLLAHAMDANGFTLITNTLTGAGTLTNAGTFLSYQPPAPDTASNVTLTVTLRDNNPNVPLRLARGNADTYKTVLGLVAIQTVPQQGKAIAIDTSALPRGVTVVFSGIPNYAYHVQRATTLAGGGNWQNLAPLTMSDTGAVQYQDANPPVPIAYYRLSYP